MSPDDKNNPLFYPTTRMLTPEEATGMHEYPRWMPRPPNPSIGDPDMDPVPTRPDKATAAAVYDILVEHFGATNTDRRRAAFIREFCYPWGRYVKFPGKYGINILASTDGHVSIVHREDRAPEEQKALEATNVLLREIKGGWVDDYPPF